MALPPIEYTGNGILTDYTFAFNYIKEADILVYVWSGSAWTLKTKTTHYTFHNPTVEHLYGNTAARRPGFSEIENTFPVGFCADL